VYERWLEKEERSQRKSKVRKSWLKNVEEKSEKAKGGEDMVEDC
jgi:hypothetical protein